MKPLTRTILFCRVIVDKKVRQYPVAVFSDKASAGQYAMLLSMAHKTGDTATAVKLDPKTAVDGDGHLHTAAAWSALDVPYAPTADLGSVLEGDSEPAHTT